MTIYRRESKFPQKNQPEPPTIMPVLKYIYPRQDIPLNERGEHRIVAHILSDVQPSMDKLRKMANELRKTFPGATDDEIEGGRIHRSAFHHGFAIVTWSGYATLASLEGWTIKPGQPNYAW